MNVLFYLIAFLEWFTTLSVEIMSIRNSVSIIWSNSISTSVILWIILMALSYWYYRWWILASNNSKDFIKLKIYKNLLIASLFYLFLSFPLENALLVLFLKLNFWYFISIFLSILILFFIPVFLASQTIPLLSELIDSNKKGETIWKLLFFSTVGSFLGSILTSLVFFPLIWVVNSIVLNSIILSGLVLLMLYINRKNIWKYTIYLNLLYFIFLFYLIFIDLSKYSNNNNVVYSFNSPHNDIKVINKWENILFSMNWSYSSWINRETKDSYFEYIKEVTSIIKEEKPKRVLVIWAAWFSLPQSISKFDFIEKIDVCDIDSSLKDITEKYFLKEKLSEKIEFYPVAARYLLTKKIQENKKYDFIFVDAYHWRMSIPSQLLTKEFFIDLKKISSWTITMNLIFDNLLKTDFYNNLSTTLAYVFESPFIKPMKGNLNYWNFIFVDNKREWYQILEKKEWWKIYLDNKHSLAIDKYNLFYSAK